MATEPSATTVDTGDGKPRADRAWMVLALVCVCQFMVILDASIVNVALPSIQHDLGFATSTLAWVVNGYLLTFAGFMLLGGRAADIFGQRNILVAGLFLFSAASLVGGIASSPGLLVGARVVQGMGAAMLAPSTLAVINSHFTTPGERARAFGAWSASGGVGGMAGAVVGGAITTGLSWRWVFLLNVPIGAVLIAVALVCLTAARSAQRQTLDFAGAITGTLGLGALIYGVMQSTDHGWASGLVLGPLAAGVLLLVVFTVIEAKFSKQPMMPLRLFKIRTVATGTAMLLLFGGVAMGMWYFTSMYLQNAMGYTALKAGLGQTPAAVMFLVVTRFAALLLPKLGARNLLLSGCACFVVGFGWLSQASVDAGYLASVLGPTLFIALGIGFVFPTLMATATSEAPEGDGGIVGGMASTASQAGGSIGLAALSTAAGTKFATVAAAGATTAAAYAEGYDLVFMMAAGIAVAIALISLLVSKRQPQEAPPVEVAEAEATA